MRAILQEVSQASVHPDGAMGGRSPFRVSTRAKERHFSSLRSHVDSTSLRVDHSFSANFSAFLRYGDTPSYGQTRQLWSGAANHVDIRTLTFGANVSPPPARAHGDDAYTARGDVNSPSTLRLKPRGTPLWRTSWFNLAPRFGTAWTLNSKPRAETIMRTGCGDLL